MTKEPKTIEEVRQWQREYKLFQEAWLDWLVANEPRYKSVEDAWLAFKTQWQGTIFIPG
ncbi:MAG: hypothetical protein OES12_01090 [Anaerolineae bacterium]|nr:hypothetical protein [Anaerolineae bacterium]